MRKLPLFVMLGLILTGLLVGFTVEQNVVEDTDPRSDPDAANWDISALDTAKDADYLTGVEKDMVLEMNKARTDPKKYADLYIKAELQYYNGKKYVKPGQPTIMMQEGTAVVNECAAEMINTAPMGALTPERGMSLGAKDHAIDQGKTGETGHAGSDESDPFDRLFRYGDNFSTAGENLAYGPATGREIVIQLLVDDGVPSRSHRVNILKSEYTQTGVAFGPHPKFRTVCAINYAKDYKTNIETVLARTTATK